MLHTLPFHIFGISPCKKMGPNELKYYAFFLQVIHTFIFSIQIFFHISRHSLGVLKNFIFGTLKKQNKTKQKKINQKATLNNQKKSLNSNTNVYFIHKNQPRTFSNQFYSMKMIRKIKLNLKLPFGLPTLLFHPFHLY